jgi:AraC-like DNA-binding protein
MSRAFVPGPFPRGPIGRALLPHGKANRQTIAKALRLTERTLAQKLGEENTNYEKVVDRLRHRLALQYIKEPSVSVAQIAWLLGYEGPTSFRPLDGPIGVRGARRESESERRQDLEAEPRPVSSNRKTDAAGRYPGDAREQGDD